MPDYGASIPHSTRRELLERWVQGTTNAKLYNLPPSVYGRAIRFNRSIVINVMPEVGRSRHSLERCLP